MRIKIFLVSMFVGLLANATDSIVIQDPVNTWQKATVSASGALNVNSTPGAAAPPLSVALVDKSGTLGSGAAVTVSNASARKYLRITAPSTNTGSLWFCFTATATSASPSFEITPGGSEVWAIVVPNQALSIIGTSGDKYTINEN